MFSVSNRSARRAARLLRWATSPARLATRRPWMATGTTIAIKASAASTSASVKPARRRQTRARYLAARAVVAGLVLNLIVQSVGRLHDPERLTVPSLKGKTVDAGGTDGAIRQKMNSGQLAGGARGLRAALHDTDSQILVQCEIHSFPVVIRVSGLQPQAVSPTAGIQPEHGGNALGNCPALAVVRQGEQSERFRILGSPAKKARQRRRDQTGSNRY